MNRRLAVDVAACEAAACPGLSARRLAEDSNLRKALSRGQATHDHEVRTPASPRLSRQ
jgi:hypothetical protein